MPRFAKLLTTAILAVALLIPAALAESAAIGKTTDNLRLREEPSLSSSVLMTVKKGECVTVTAEDPIVNSDATWYAVLYNGKEGYMSAEFLEIIPNGTDISEKGYINTDSVRLRAKPNTNCDILKVFGRGTEVEITGTEDGWYCVRHDGKEGYVRGDLVNIGEAPKTAVSAAVSAESAKALATLDSSGATALQRELIEKALTYIGKPYKYGKAGPDSFDCSGFTSFIYKQFGYSIQRSSRDQYRLTGQAVGSKADLIPGDLVFFRTTSSSAVTHAGIYVGGGQFIHASSGKGKSVMLSPINEGYYNNRYVGAKRVL